MKKYVGIAVLLCVFLVLSGCGGCKHEWVEADCLTAKTCTLCREVEGEALGHDWQEAACETPKTCARCALTEGAAPGHSYGKWEMAEKEMKRACEVCGTQETVEPDYDVYLQQEMRGYWVTYYSGRAYFLKFGEERSFSGSFGKEIAGTWRLQDTGASDGSKPGDCMIELCCSQNGNNQVQTASVDVGDPEEGKKLSGESIELSLCIDGEEYVFSWLPEEHIETWKCAQREGVQKLEGTWLIREKEDPDETLGNNVWFSIKHDMGGEFSADHIFFARWTFDGAQIRSDDITYHYSWKVLGSEEAVYQITLYDENELSLELPLETGEITTVRCIRVDMGNEEVVAEAVKKPVGNWCSDYVEVFYTAPGAHFTGEYTVEYSAAFYEDGTYTACLDQTYSGNWEFSGIDIKGRTVTFLYDCSTSEGGKDTLWLEIDIHGAKLCRKGEEATVRYYLEQMTEQERDNCREEIKAGRQAIIGTWVSCGYPSWLTVTEDTPAEPVRDYKLTFREDGTVEGMLDEPINTKWCLSSFGEDCSYYYFMDPYLSQKRPTIEYGTMIISYFEKEYSSPGKDDSFIMLYFEKQ